MGKDEDMARDRWMTDDEVARVRAPLESAWTLPPAAYDHDRLWEIEAATIFRRDWNALARLEQLPEIGDQLPVELGGQPLVLVHTGEREVRAFANVCLHRAMPLIEEATRSSFLTCPYHLWSYDLTGQLRTAPMMDGLDDFAPDQMCLPEFAVELWEGFVFVNLDRDPEPLAPQIEPLRAVMERFGFAEKVVVSTTEFDSPWNWKLLVENFMEAYHHTGPHRTTLQPTYPAAQSYVPDNHGGPWSVLRMPGDGVELIAAVVWPTLLIAGSEFGPVWYQLDVDGHDHFTLRVHLLDDPAKVGTEQFDAALPARTAAVRHVHIEDIAVNEGPWRGLRAPATTQGRLSRYEASIWQLNQLWLDRVQTWGEPGADLV